jgi:hypothetical protein
MAVKAKGRNGRGARNGAGAPAEEIARVAYQLFERRGGGHGQDQQDWFEAERIVRARRLARAAE